MTYNCNMCEKQFKTYGGAVRHIANIHEWCVKHNDDYGLELDENCNYVKDCGCFELDENCNIVKVGA